MSEERFDRLESLILSIATRMDTMQQDMDRRFDTMQNRMDNMQQNVDTIQTQMVSMQQDIDTIQTRMDTTQENIAAIRTRIDAEGTMTDTFERYFTQMMQQTNETSQLSRDTNRDLGTVEERVDRVERQQRRTNSRLNDLEDRA
jgi:chromosome segregation ATPase